VAGVASALVIAGAVAVAHSTWLLHRRICSLTLSINRAAIRPVLTESMPFFLMVLVVLVYNQIDMILLSLMSGDHETGIYAAAMKPFEATTLIPAGVMGTLLPALSRDWTVSRERFFKTFTIGFRYMGTIGLPLAVGGVVCAAPLLQLLYGGRYEESARVFQVLIVAVVFSFWNHLFSAALIAMDRERDLLMIGIGGVIVSLAFNLFLIPRYGAIGSGIATIGTQLFLFLMAFIPIFREMKSGLNVVVTLFRPVLCTSVMAAALWLIQGSPLPLLILVGVTVYFGVLLAIGLVRSTQIKLLLGRY
jgi:O-antigen/teichoic acid export membrane protein